MDTIVNDLALFPAGSDKCVWGEAISIHAPACRLQRRGRPTPNMESLKQRLISWTDVDVASYELAVVLGLMNLAEHPIQSKAKHVFWSTHPIGEELAQVLSRLADVGVLECRTEPDLQYRWSRSFKGSWE